MSMIRAILSDGPALTQAAHAAIVDAIDFAWQCKAPGSRRPTEPEMVACLSLRAAPAIAVAWRHILVRHDIRLSAASVFCHGRPIVDFGGSKNVELGDILFVHKHRALTGTVHRNALLLQAKVASVQPYSVGSNETHQLQLYQKWPDFDYVTPNSLRGQSRQVWPKTWHKGAQYLQIDDRPPANPMAGLRGGPFFPAGACLPQNPLVIHHHLASELLDWLGGLSGRPFGDKGSPAIADGWSRVVWDLLESACNKALAWKRKPYRGKHRYAGDKLHLFDGTLTSANQDQMAGGLIVETLGENAGELFGPPNDNVPRDDVPAEGDGGVSVVVIDTMDTTGEGENRDAIRGK